MIGGVTVRVTAHGLVTVEVRAEDEDKGISSSVFHQYSIGCSRWLGIIYRCNIARFVPGPVVGRSHTSVKFCYDNACETKGETCCRELHGESCSGLESADFR